MTAYDCSFDNLLVVDFSTTLEKENYDFAPEIIQFSVTVLDVKNKRIREDISFDEYCKPIIGKKLTDYCIETTGVQQENVDSARPFKEVYDKFVAWLKENDFQEKKFAVVCHSPLTMWKDAQYQFNLINQPLPGFFRQWIDVATHYLKVTQKKFEIAEILQNNLPRLAEHYEIPLQGELFDSVNNSMNIARIVQKMLEMGQKVEITGLLTCFDKSRTVPLTWAKSIIWQRDPVLFHRMQMYMLPLIYKQLNHSDRVKFGVCPYCRKGPEECTGLIHKRFPTELIADFKATSRQVSTFAVYLNLEDD